MNVKQGNSGGYSKEKETRLSRQEQRPLKEGFEIIMLRRVSNDLKAIICTAQPVMTAQIDTYRKKRRTYIHHDEPEYTDVTMVPSVTCVHT
jgi:hypothetical protein